MSTLTRWLASAAAAVLLLAGAACGDGDDSADRSAASQATDSPAPPATLPTTSAATTPSAEPVATTPAPTPPGSGFDTNSYEQSEVLSTLEGDLVAGGTALLVTPAMPHLWGVGFQWYGCKQTVGVNGFDGITFSLKLGTDGRNGTRIHREEQGNGYLPGTTLPAERKNATNRYAVRVHSEAGCKYILSFVGKNQATTTGNLGTQVMTMRGQDDDNIDIPAVRAPWHVAWQYDCNNVLDGFTLADSGLIGLRTSNHIVEKYENENEGVFTQTDARANGARTLTVVTGETCTWKVTVFQQ